MTAASIPATSLRGNPRRRGPERIVHGLFFGAALGSVLISVLIVASLLGGAIDFLRIVDLGKLVADGWYPRRDEFDLATLIVGSFIVTFIATLVAVPVGLLAAIYLSEYANRRARSVIKPILEILAGIPSVVIGFFALTWISPNVVQLFNPKANDFSLLAAGLGVGVLTIPLIASISEDSLRAVPTALREASYGLGARRMTTSLRIVVPAAISGIVASVILGVSRAIGETMVVAVAAGGSGGSQFTANPFEPGQTITAAMAALATGTDQVVGSTAAFQSLFFLGLVLFILTLVFNQLGELVVRRTRQIY
ncbi:MAG TPA: phosphate ABC transporter permease subunit PstC [Candidatus Polarisedimenticolia bacterium]|nr:phosphate ABC transporter permease subunit PstC [Candidatus Polarisedimenticolia bacterium]